MASLWVDLYAAFRRQIPRAAVGLAAVLLCWRALPELPPPGWDEAEHLGLPAIALWDHVRHGELAAAAHALLRQEQYPPGATLAIWPAVWLGGPDPAAARAGVVALFGLLSVLAGAIADHLAGSRETTRAGWIAQGLVLASPAAVFLARSLFLEIPFAALAALGTLLYVKLERRELEALPPGRPRTLAVYLLPGTIFAWACFTKWSYGSLLAAALVIERLAALHSARPSLRRSSIATAWLLAPLLCACAWWFAYPWPAEGLPVGAAHRFALASYLGEPRAEGAQAPAVALYLGWYHHLSPAVLGGVALLAALAAGHRGRPGLRWVALLAALQLGAVVVHPFKLARLFLPGLVFVWILAGVGLHAATRGWRAPLKALSVLLLAFLALLSAGEGLLPPQRFGLAEVPPAVLGSWREAYAGRTIEASGPEGLPALAELVVEAERHRVRVGEEVALRVVRTGHELSDAALAWSLFLARRAASSAPAAERAPARSAYESFDVVRLGLSPPWARESEQRFDEEARRWLAPAGAVLILDPGTGPEREFRAADHEFSRRWREAVRRALPQGGFRLAREEPRFAFSRRRASVALELWTRALSKP